MFRRLTLALLLFAPVVVSGTTAPDGQDRVGVTAPEFKLQKWINSTPLEVGDLRNKVVLVRWWTDMCDLCAATAPALRKLQEKYGSQGFQVIGVFHPKPSGDWDLDRVKRAASKYEFTFPIALDGDWSALKRWWLDGAQRDYTSVSFILDKHGVIRYVHPGGEFHESNGSPAHQMCERDFKAIERTVAQLLAEK